MSFIKHFNLKFGNWASTILLFFTCLLIILFFRASYAQVQKTALTCIFSHPYMVIIFDPEDSSVTYYDEFEAATLLSQNAKLQPHLESFMNPDVHIASPGSRYKIVRPNGQMILTLDFNYSGFDGSSEMSYPFSAIFHDQYGDQFGGGCYTENAMPINYNDIINELKN